MSEDEDLEFMESDFLADQEDVETLFLMEDLEEKEMKRKKWSYKATLDYIKECEKGKWVIGFLDEDGNPYECPTTTNRELVEKVGKLSEQKLKVIVEVNEAPNEYGSEFPTLIDVEEI